MFPIPLRSGLRPYSSAISHVTPAEEFRIGIQNFFVIAGFRHAKLVFFPHNGSEVAANQQEIRRIFRASYEGDDRILNVVKIDPFKTGIIKINP